MPTDDAALLADHPLVASLRPAERAAVVAVADVRHVPVGTTVVAAGDGAPPLVLLLTGSLRVCRGGLELALLTAGTWVGELSLLHDQDATADVVTVEDCVLGVIARGDATGLLAIDALAMQLDTVARRRTATNRAVTSAPVTAWARDGRPVVLRPVWPSDWRALAVEERRVSAESMRMRFFSPPPLTERTFRRLTAVDLHDQFAWAAFVDDELAGIGRHALTAEDRGVAELALLVADDHQGRGLGRLLLTAVVVAVEAHGADELLAIARRENTPVQRLLQPFGATFAPAGGSDVVQARWPLATALAVVGSTELRARLADLAGSVLAPVVEG